MKLLDSRRLTGPNLLLDRAGAVLEVSLEPAEAQRAVAAWQEQARHVLDAVGWGEEEAVARIFPGGASLAISAPIDGLYAATEVNEWAWTAAETVVRGIGDPPDPAEAAGRLRAEIERERNPALLALRQAAGERGVAFLWGEGLATVGLGKGSRTWPLDALPAPGEVDWDAVHDIPVLLVTGTNGKTTTVRLLSAMLRAAGKAVGTTSTDRVEVGGETLDQGDCSGPGGARTLLRDRRVEVAVLETARGGILRRGLAIDRADAALVTNIAADHLGEFGVHDLSSLAAAKLVVTRAVSMGGTVVLNADDPELVRASRALVAPVSWFSLDPENPVLRTQLGVGGPAAFLSGDELVLVMAGERRTVARVGEVPTAFGGAARYNVANALAAIALAATLHLPLEPMAAGLRAFESGPEDNPGRANLLERDGVRILLDYAHNPHGIEALLPLAATLPAERRLLLIGQAGDRDDEALRDFARATWPFQPDFVVVKELPEMLRGRQPGEVPAILEDEFRRLGMAPQAIVRTDSEIEGVQRALEWAQPGDVLLLLVHTQREAVMEMLRG
ncbi:MAG TPA: Mur ligase family protein [Thermoanaerobaculia bacterium]|nr:Mur ligase family protein [Thermoanaerobaculia bacterium]